jgi:hypothetical protein
LVGCHWLAALRVAAVGDVYEPNLERAVATAAKGGRAPQSYRDYRRLLDDESGKRSDPFEVVACEFGFDVARVLDLRRFEEQDFDFFLGDGAMLHAAWDDQEFAFVQINAAVAEVHPEAAFDDQKHFILTHVMVPDEFALELDEFDVLAVEFGDDAGIPMIVDESELLAQVDRRHSASMKW